MISDVKLFHVVICLIQYAMFLQVSTCSNLYLLSTKLPNHGNWSTVNYHPVESLYLDTFQYLVVHDSLLHL